MHGQAHHKRSGGGRVVSLVGEGMGEGGGVTAGVAGGHFFYSREVQTIFFLQPGGANDFFTTKHTVFSMVWTLPFCTRGTCRPLTTPPRACPGLIWTMDAPSPNKMTLIWGVAWGLEEVRRGVNGTVFSAPWPLVAGLSTTQKFSMNPIFTNTKSLFGKPCRGQLTPFFTIFYHF